jgi:hypothetical protein
MNNESIVDSVFVYSFADNINPDMTKQIQPIVKRAFKSVI